MTATRTKTRRRTRRPHGTRFVTVKVGRLKGLNEDENPTSIAEDELIQPTRNAWRRGETKGTRPGTIRDPDDYTVNLSGAVQGIQEFRKDNNATRHMVGVINGNIYSDSSTSIKGSAVVTSGAGNRWTFAQHKAQIYGAGGAGGDWFWKWGGTGNVAVVGGTFSPITESDGTTEVTPSYVFQWQNRLFTAGFRRTGGTISTDISTNPMTARFSELNNGDSWPLQNTIGGTSAIGGLSAYGDEFITGFGEYRGNNDGGGWLIVMTNKQLYFYQQTGDPFAPMRLVGGTPTGCVHQNASVSLGLDSGDMIYLSNQGIHSLRQSQQFGARQDATLSWKIRKTFQTLNQSSLDAAVGAYWKERGLVLFAVPTGSSPIPDTILALDVKGKEQVTAANAEWDIWERSGSSDNEKAITALATARNSTDDWFIYGGTAAGDVVQFNDETHSDLGTGYQTKIPTKHSDAGLPGMVKGLGDVFATVQPGADYQPTYTPAFDFGARKGTARAVSMPALGSVWGTAVWGTDAWGFENATRKDKVYAKGSGETISHEFSHSGVDEPFYIASLEAQLRPFGEMLGDT